MRTLSDNATTSLLQRVTDEIWIVLLTVNIDGAIYYVVAGCDHPIMSNGVEYKPYAFDVVLPSDSLESVEQVQLAIDNIDRMFIDGIRSARNPIRFEIKLALYSQPDIIELELLYLETQLITIDEFTIRATLILTDIWNQKFPAIGERYDPAQAPRLF